LSILDGEAGLSGGQCRKEKLVLSNISKETSPPNWTDTDNIGTHDEANLLFNNEREGIRDEANYDTTIRNNTALRNGNNESLCSCSVVDAQILLLDTSPRLLFPTELPADGGNGIAILNQNRSSGPFGAQASASNIVEILKVGNEDSKHWNWFSAYDWAGFRGNGQEANGTCCI
jgi:hypothetical protein